MLLLAAYNQRDPSAFHLTRHLERSFARGFADPLGFPEFFEWANSTLLSNLYGPHPGTRRRAPAASRCGSPVISARGPQAARERRSHTGRVGRRSRTGSWTEEHPCSHSAGLGSRRPEAQEETETGVQPEGGELRSLHPALESGSFCLRRDTSLGSFPGAVCRGRRRLKGNKSVSLSTHLLS